MSTLRVNQILDLNGNVLGGSIPAGTIVWYGGTTVPTGWLKCNGASLSTTTYSSLFGGIGYTFGGSGASFNVPDLRGEFIRGWDDARGIDSGRSFGSFQDQSFQNHNHQINVSGADDNNHTGNGDGPSDSDAGMKGYIRNTSTNNGGANETRPRNRALMAIIKT